MIDGWTFSTLGEAVSLIRNGLNCKQNKSGEGDKISRIETIANADVNPDKVGYSVLTNEQKKRYKLQNGDILFSHINSVIHVGKTAYINDDYDLYHGVNLLLFRSSDDVDPRFLEYFLKKLFIFGYWETRCKRSVNQASVNQTDIKGVPFNYPSLPEQKRIVAILDEVFAGITQAITNAEKNLANTRELFESYLNSVFTQKGEVWVVKRFEDLVESATIGLVKSKREQGKDLAYRYIKMNNIANDNRFDDTNTTNVDAEEKELIKYQLLDKDFLFNTRNSYELVGKNCLYRSSSDEPVLYNNNIMRIRFRPEIDAAFSAYAFTSDGMVNQLELIKHGTTNVSAIYYKSLKDIFMQFPSLPEQKRIVEQLNVLREMTQHLETIYQQKLTVLAELKQSILQKAFTGELTADVVYQQVVNG